MAIPRDTRHAGTRLMKVDKHAAICVGYLAESGPDQTMTIAIERSEYIAINTARMDTHQNVRPSGDVPVNDRKVHFSVYLAPVLNGPEFPECRPDMPFGLAL